MSNGPRSILALGDSLVAGYGLAAADGFAARLEQRLRATGPVSVIDAGVSGNTTADVARRLPRVLTRLSGRPDLAIVQVGPNDVIRRVPPAAARANLDTILTELSRCGVRVLLTTVAPPPFLQAHAAPYAGIHQEVAARHGAVVHPFFPPGVLGHPEMVLADRLHPNAKAIAAVVDALLPVIERMLEWHRTDTVA